MSSLRNLAAISTKAEAVRALRAYERELWIDEDKMTLLEDGSLNPNALLKIDEIEERCWKILEDAEDHLPHSPNDLLKVAQDFSFCALVRKILCMK